jgi:hypothetical protein
VREKTPAENENNAEKWSGQKYLGDATDIAIPAPLAEISGGVVFCWMISGSGRDGGTAESCGERAAQRLLPGARRFLGDLQHQGTLERR